MCAGSECPWSRRAVSKLPAHLDCILRAFGGENAGRQREARDLPHPQFLLGVLAQEGNKELPGDALATRDGDVRTKPAEVRFEAGIEDGILDVLMQGEGN
jgi:hypothetical protein